MTIEINELVIRAVVEGEPQERAEGRHSPEDDDDRDAIIQACVREVMQILRRRERR